MVWGLATVSSAWPGGKYEGRGSVSDFALLTTTSPHKFMVMTRWYGFGENDMFFVNILWNI